MGKRQLPLMANGDQFITDERKSYKNWEQNFNYCLKRITRVQNTLNSLRCDKGNIEAQIHRCKEKLNQLKEAAKILPVKGAEWEESKIKKAVKETGKARFNFQEFRDLMIRWCIESDAVIYSEETIQARFKDVQEANKKSNN